MAKSAVCEDETSIRALLIAQGAGLILEMQEILIAWRKEMDVPVLGVLKLFDPGSSGRGGMVEVHFSSGLSIDVPLSEIVYFEVLSTKKMNSRVAYAQMIEMERAGRVAS